MGVRVPHALRERSGPRSGRRPRIIYSTRRGDPWRTRPTTPRVSRVAARPAPVSLPARRPSSSRFWPSCARSSSRRGRS
ncbi:hypothetical protein [Ornithinimicrobium kibberense]|uniref:hypothetical protein n=1 Tax=Ornithinimicrobium kibberense TaxID=282060 RepID=UPI00360FA7C6